MKRNSLRTLLIIASISIGGIMATQIYWTRKAFDIKQQEFTVNVSIGLKNVAETILKYDHQKPELQNPVSRLSYKYFVAEINNPIPPALLDSLLPAEMARRNISTNFGYVIYEDNKLVYSRCVAVSSRDTSIAMLQSLPGWQHHNAYFGVYFPKENGLIFSGMGIWMFSSIVLLVVIVYFCYTMFIILRQKRLSEVQRDFVNNMTHEFNTPLASILASAEVLQQQGIVQQPERLKTYAGLVQQQASKLQQHVAQVLEIASAEEDIRLNKTPVDIHQVLHECIAAAGKTHTSKPVHISADFAAKNAVVQADKMHITSVFSNLIDNAIKYSGAQADLEITTSEKPGSISICAADKGIGIARHDLRRIFEKFYRVQHGNVHDVKGFGLGLYYVKNIIKAHKGTIEVESELQKGTCFYIFLPYR